MWNHGAEFANAQGISGGLGASAVRFKHAANTEIAAKWEQGYMPQSIDEFENRVLKAKSENFLGPDDVVYFGVPGSSGYGDPLKREPERVLADIKKGILSPGHALQFYGVVVKGAEPEIDHEATEAERQRVRQIRMTCARYLDEWDELVPPEKEEPAGPREPRDEYRPSPPLRDLFEVGMSLKIVRDKERRHWWACAECGHVYGPADQDPKEQALIRVGYLSTMSHPTAEMARRDPPRFFQRQFYCPQCALMFTNEMARADDPLLHEIEYSPQWLDSLE